MFDRYGSTQIRNVASIGGNLGSASPIGDSLPALLALNAKLILQSKNQRLLDIKDFFKGYRKTALKNKEFIKEIRIPILKSHIFKCRVYFYIVCIFKDKLNDSFNIFFNYFRISV